MWRIRDSKVPVVTYRQYSPAAMATALQKVRETGAAIRKTAREFNLPESSLRHKLSGRVNPEATHSGPQPLFSALEENQFVEHLKMMSACGYGYSRSEVVDMATEYAICLGKRDQEHPLTVHWYTGFMSRWPQLKILKPRGLEMQRAKAVTVDCVQRYYTELGSILTKYDLKGKPERIFNVDEKGLSTRHKPPFVVTGVDTKPPAVTSGSRTNVTVIGCGNAQGMAVPPYFIFPGARMRQELLDGCTTGADGEVSETGWSNSHLFRKYLEDHLLKYLPQRSESNPVLVLYDGHKSHINLGLIEWAKSQHMILFILPAHTSHVLQTLDIGCFGRFEKIYNQLSHKFMREHCGHSITRYNICAIGCAAYVKAMSPANLQSSFKKAGIYPFNANVINPSNFKPSEVLQQASPSDPSTQPIADRTAESFFLTKEASVISKKPPTKKRRCLSSVVSGKAITEEKTVQAILQFDTGKVIKPQSKAQPIPGPSGLTRQPELVPSDESEVVEDNEKCCVCKLFTPADIRNSTSVIFVKWAECDQCGHWVHLSYCTSVRVIRRGDTFLCPHCKKEE